MSDCKNNKVDYIGHDVNTMTFADHCENRKPRPASASVNLHPRGPKLCEVIFETLVPGYYSSVMVLELGMSSSNITGCLI